MAHGGRHRNIVIPLDPSDHSLRAFEWYLFNIKKSGDVLVFVHIVEPQYATSAMSIADTIKCKIEDMGSKMESASKRAQDLVDKYIKLAESNDIHAKGVIHVDNKAGEGLVRVASEQGANLVIIGNRGIGSIRRTILGSTSDFLISHVNVPVIIVPPPK